MATTQTHIRTQWDTLHRNGPFPIKQHLVTRLESNALMPSKFDRYNDAATEIRRLISDSQLQQHGFRPFGSRWSMSSIAHQKDRVHQNNLMHLDLPILPADLHAQTGYKAENLFFFQCGNTVREISQVLEAHGKSLKASGASNGQTIAGCISTGVHGSAWQEGAVQDYIVGLNLIIGPKPEDVVYLERHNKPALSDAFAAKIQARVIRNDNLFHAALVGLGSFGFIHGVVIEAEDRFLLHRYVRKIDKTMAEQLAVTMDFINSQFKITEEIDAQGNPLLPYHFKIFINPYTNDNQYVVEAMYKKTPYHTNYPDPLAGIEKSLYRDLIYLLIKISEKFPNSIPWFIKRLEKEILPEVDPAEEKIIGTLYEIFWDAPYQGPAFACSVGVDHKDSIKALNLLTKMTREEGPVPGIFAMRFVRQSTATLAFTRFPITCVIEIDGIIWKGTNNLISLESYGRRMVEVLKNNQIKFTSHWGKNLAWDFPGLIPYMYGDKAKQWKNYRNSLLSDEMAKLFSNDFLDITGLSLKEANIPPNLIVSLPSDSP